MYDTGEAMRENRSEDQKVNATTQTNALTSHQKSPYGTSRRSYAPLKILLKSTSNSASIDVSSRQKIWSEGIE
jgi:hypothetical protein